MGYIFALAGGGAIIYGLSTIKEGVNMCVVVWIIIHRRCDGALWRYICNIVERCEKTPLLSHCELVRLYGSRRGNGCYGTETACRRYCYGY
ncbi:MAG: hypothetical protein OCU17_02830 [Methanophagales archaeon]|nr:hypothetical protein [Methanophagales archaeon]